MYLFMLSPVRMYVCMFFRAAVLLITLRKGQLSPVASQEEQLAEKLATGSDADPYVTIHIQESPSSASTRVWDSWTSTVQVL